MFYVLPARQLCLGQTLFATKKTRGYSASTLTEIKANIGIACAQKVLELEMIMPLEMYIVGQ